MKIVVATRNRHKLAEIRALLASLDLVAIDEIAPGAVLREDEPTFEANAMAKARQAVAATGLPAIGDDSGLEVDALGGEPGVLSARWSGEPCDDARNNAKLMERMRAVPAAATSRRAARFRCAAAFIDPVRGIEIVRTGACEGTIIDAPRGDGGFGYDPLFVVDGLGRTMAELTPAEKNEISHRAVAFRALARSLAPQ